MEATVTVKSLIFYSMLQKFWGIFANDIVMRVLTFCINTKGNCT